MRPTRVSVPGARADRKYHLQPTAGGGNDAGKAKAREDPPQAHPWEHPWSAPGKPRRIGRTTEAAAKEAAGAANAPPTSQPGERARRSQERRAQGGGL